MSNKWKIKSSDSSLLDQAHGLKHWTVENDDGDKREVTTHSWEDEERVGEKISEGRFSD